ncbi:hypothetical protein KKH35_03445 [Patescibacteria group bacterium]|nr:hypothetical protein [Patescibacteria group bacterium]
MKKELIPGSQIISVISAMPGGFAEEVLKQIAHPEILPLANVRKFSQWENGMSIGQVILKGEEREFVLKIGVKEGLFLEDSRNFSLKHTCDGDKCIIPISSNSKGRRSKGRSSLTVANNIVGSWIIHGQNWQDRSGDFHFWPYGIDSNRKSSYDFSVKDGKNLDTFNSAIEKGVVRSGHIGTWKSPVILVPSAAGVPVILHEFQEKSNGSGSVVMFGDKRISPESYDEIWGPYAEWDPEVLNQVDFGNFRDLVQELPSPFNFHVAATRSIFPNCRLASEFILSQMEENKILEILRIIVEKDSERYYRLIDESGRTYRLKEIDGNIATYTGYQKEIKFDLNQAPENVFQTFSELAQIQDNPMYKISQRVRVVLDSHFYIVVFGILTTKDGKSHHLSGRYMHKYLLEGADSYMHRIRNDRLFSLIKQLFGINKLEFVIYPSASLRLPRVNQYNFDPKTWNPKHWLVKKL